MDPDKEIPALTPPVHVRRSVVGFAAALAIITYVDRVCIAQAAPDIQRDFGLTAVQMGLIFSAFSLAYAIFEIPGALLGDWFGPRKVLLRIVLTWSFFTAATGYAWNFGSMLVARFFFGAGEAGCFPNLAKAFAIWLPPGERTRAQGITWLSARWGGAFTPLLVIWVMTWLSWRNTFVVFGSFGVIWAFFFYRAFRSDPAEKAMHEANAAAGGRLRVPWRKMLSTPSVLLLWAQYACLAYAWTFYITWLPTYLQETRGAQLDQNTFMFWLGNVLGGLFSADTTQKILVAALAGIPLFFGGIGSIFCGQMTPYLVRAAGSMARARKIWALSGFMGASILLISSYYIKDPLLAMLAMGVASFCNDLVMPGSWSTSMDVGGRYAATVAGGMNMMSAVGAACASPVIGLILQYTDRNWGLAFWLSGSVYFLGSLCWWYLDPVTPFESRKSSKTV